MEAKRSNRLDSPPVPHLRLHTAPTLPPDLPFRSTFSPGQLKSALKASASHNLYEMMHARDTDAHFNIQSTPDLHLHRAKTPSISALTARENARLEQRLNVGNSGPSRPLERIGTVRLLGSVPGDTDFKRILDKLNRITSRGGAQDKRLALEEGKSVNVILEEDEWVYAKSTVKGLRTPLQVTIKRQQGKIITYISKTAQEPSQALCDSVFKTDIITATDIGLRFKCTHLFFAFHAIESSVFTVSIAFGKRRRTAKSSSRQIQINSEDTDLTFLRVRKTVSVLRKDFLSLNRRQISASTGRFERIKEHRAISEERHKEAVKRRNEHQIMKKTMALMAINRMEIRKQEKLEREKIREMKEYKENVEKGWMVLMVSAQGVEKWVEQMNSRKLELQYEQWKDGMVRKIQRRVRRYHQYQSTSLLAAVSALHHIHLIACSFYPLDLPSLQRHIFSSLHVSSMRMRLTTTFSQFYTRSNFHLVLTIQRAWKAAIRLKKSRFDRLNTVWSQSFGLVLEEACKRKPSKKSKKPKENPTSKYFAITPFRKSQVLMQHYLEAKQRFILDLKAFTISKRAGDKPVPPGFEYAPSVKEMMQIIEKAANFDL